MMRDPAPTLHGIRSRRNAPAAPPAPERRAAAASALCSLLVLAAACSDRAPTAESPAVDLPPADITLRERRSTGTAGCAEPS